jgi:ABC-2 type transport system permease protein
MQAFITLVRRELTGYFLSPAGYVVIAAIQVLFGLSFSMLLKLLNGRPFDMPVTEKFYDTGFFWLILLLVSPIITMRTFALEKFSGTFETLMTTPVGDLQVVLAKFTGALAFYLLAWAPILAYPYLLRHYSVDLSRVDTGILASSCLGNLLFGAFYISIGCFASSLTRSQIVAAINTFLIGTGLFMLSFLSLVLPPQPDLQSQVLAHISMMDHMREFSRGIVDTRHVVFYLSMTTFFLYLTFKVIEARRWK